VNERKKIRFDMVPQKYFEYNTKPLINEKGSKRCLYTAVTK